MSTSEELLIVGFTHPTRPRQLDAASAGPESKLRAGVAAAHKPAHAALRMKERCAKIGLAECDARM
jgi:hypothetical protein